jgi:hypothetical protein
MAATLASAVVGYQAMNGSGDRLLDRGFINAVVMLVIFTCVVGPILTERFAQGLPEGKHPHAPNADGAKERSRAASSPRGSP